METYNDCYLFGFVGEAPKESVYKDIWKASLPMYFLASDQKLIPMEIVLSDTGKKCDFLKKKPYEVLWVHGHLQYHQSGAPYLFVEEYADVGLSKSKRSALLRLMGHTGSLVFLKGKREEEALFVPRVGQWKNVTDGDRFTVDGGTAVRGQIRSDYSIEREEGVCLN